MELKEPLRSDEELDIYADHGSLSKPGGLIRLLTLYPAPDFASNKDEPPVVCSMTVVDLDNAPAYYALSYEWGVESNTNKVAQIGTPPPHIQLDGNRFYVRPNLLAALEQIRHLRTKQGSVVMWIDAICINQNDTTERSSQVQIMGDIFQYAASVLFWTGRAEHDSDIAMDLIRAVGTETVSIPNTRTWKHYPPIAEVRTRLAVKRWFDRPVWGRAWILQEFVLGHELQLICGGQVLDWPTLANFDMKWKESSVMNSVQSLDPGLFILWMYKLSPIEWFRLRRAHEMTKPKPSMLSVMLVLRNFKATLLKDQIYALLSITSHNITADYAKLIDTC
jgi:Heterokaryon incompatibility protein (HET)